MGQCDTRWAIRICGISSDLQHEHGLIHKLLKCPPHSELIRWNGRWKKFPGRVGQELTLSFIFMFIDSFKNWYLQRFFVDWCWATLGDVFADLQNETLFKNQRVLQSELFGAEFKMSLYVNELIVGDIFVRIYNEQPNFVLYVSIAYLEMKKSSRWYIWILLQLHCKSLICSGGGCMQSFTLNQKVIMPLLCLIIS